jgi:hypothetical protein
MSLGREKQEMMQASKQAHLVVCSLGSESGFTSYNRSEIFRFSVPHYYYCESEEMPYL